MKNTLRTNAIGYIILASLFLPLRGIAQKLVISGKGKVANVAYWTPYAANGRVEYLFIPNEESFVLPIVKPRTKEIQIVINHKRAEFGKLENDGNSSVVKINYDTVGNLTEIIPNNFSSGRYNYENGRVVEWSGGDLDDHPAYSVESKCFYNNNGFLEKQYHRDGQFSTDLYEYKTDSKGKIISAKKYNSQGAVVDDADESYQYDAKGRLTTYKSHYIKKGDYFTGDYFRNIEKKWNWDSKGNMTSLRIKDNKNGKIDDYEYKFEYDSDNNPIRLTRYNHGDIMVITEGWEYRYSYTFYPNPIEQKRLAEEQRRIAEKQRIQDSIQRQTELIIAQENQRQAKLRELLLPFRFLFDSEEAFVSCVSSNLDVAEKEITQLIIKRMQYVSSVVISGKELQDTNHAGKKELLQICDMCIIMKGKMSQYKGTEKEFVERIFNFSENILGDFVSGRSILKRAYKKSPNSDYSVFLSAFIKTNNTNVNRVSNSDSENPVLFVIGGLLGALGVTGIAYLLSLIRQ